MINDEYNLFIYNSKQHTLYLRHIVLRNITEAWVRYEACGVAQVTHAPYVLQQQGYDPPPLEAGPTSIWSLVKARFPQDENINM